MYPRRLRGYREWNVPAVTREQQTRQFVVAVPAFPLGPAACEKPPMPGVTSTNRPAPCTVWSEQGPDVAPLLPGREQLIFRHVRACAGIAFMRHHRRKSELRRALR
jgi:hypothetical protein